MNELSSLEERLKSAIDRIEAAISVVPKAEGDTSEVAAENMKLRADLFKFKELRRRDIQQIDGLMTKIRPLLEENDA